MLHENHACLHLLLRCSISGAALHEAAKAASKQQYCVTTCSPKADMNSSRTVLLGVTSNSCVRYAHVLLGLDDIAGVWLQGACDDLQLSGLSSTVHSY